MTDDALHAGIRRSLGATGEGLVDRLASLPGADLTTLLLAVAERRSGRRTPAEIFEQYRRDRFVAAGSTDPVRLRSVEDRAFAVSADLFEPIVTAPLAPFGAHSVLGGISQNRVVTTGRNTEVAADPTTTLALEAAVRRRGLLDDDPRSTVPVRFAAVDRVTRAQVVDGPLSFAHFTLFGLVTAGRDVGNHDTEHDAVVEHIQTHVALAGDRAGVQVRLSDLSGRATHCLARILATLVRSGIDAGTWPERTAGTDYYPSLCFKVVVVDDDREIEFADGGLTDWTQQLLHNRKERLMISGAGLDRLAAG